MRTIKQIFFIILLCISYNTTIAQNLSSMPVVKRDSLLISIAIEVVLKYGPDYYREYSKPIIERQTVPQKGEINPSGVNASRVSYRVTFPYDKAEETLEWDYAAKVQIWADTGNPTGVDFGNGIGIGFQEGSDWRNVTIEPISYQEATRPIYGILTIEVPESIIGEQAREEYIQQALKKDREPLNKDELIRKGWVKQSDGQWVKTTPDVPPHKRNR